MSRGYSLIGGAFILGIIELSPGVRSVQINYEPLVSAGNKNLRFQYSGSIRVALYLETRELEYSFVFVYL